MKIYIQTDSENRLKHAGTTPIGEDSIEVEVSNMMEVFNDLSSFIYKDGTIMRGTEISLQNLKKKKDLELNMCCSRFISSGFNHTINGIDYRFSFDIEAQLNFQGARDLLNSGVLPSIAWTVKRDGVYERILITKEIMNELAMVILQHKDSSIRRYREELLPLVEGAQTEEEVNSITWD